jgi:hypothetical protein
MRSSARSVVVPNSTRPTRTIIRSLVLYKYNRNARSGTLSVLISSSTCRTAVRLHPRCGLSPRHISAQSPLTPKNRPFAAPRRRAQAIVGPFTKPLFPSPYILLKQPHPIIVFRYCFKHLEPFPLIIRLEKIIPIPAVQSYVPFPSPSYCFRTPFNDLRS